jgi:hypothetical protein
MTRSTLAPRRVEVLIPQAEEVVPATTIETLDVVCHEDGSLTVHADAVTMARLGGRAQFGDVESAQAALRDRIADAWYAADCPPTRSRRRGWLGRLRG